MGRPARPPPLQPNQEPDQHRPDHRARLLSADHDLPGVPGCTLGASGGKACTSTPTAALNISDGTCGASNKCTYACNASADCPSTGFTTCPPARGTVPVSVAVTLRTEPATADEPLMPTLSPHRLLALLFLTVAAAACTELRVPRADTRAADAGHPRDDGAKDSGAQTSEAAADSGKVAVDAAADSATRRATPRRRTETPAPANRLAVAARRCATRPSTSACSAPPLTRRPRREHRRLRPRQQVSAWAASRTGTAKTQPAVRSRRPQLRQVHERRCLPGSG